jgi:hypothetical protein
VRSTPNLKIKSREIGVLDSSRTFVAKGGADPIKEDSTRADHRSGVLEDTPLSLTHAGRVFMPGAQ